jgi:hypothetical protein
MKPLYMNCTRLGFMQILKSGWVGIRVWDSDALFQISVAFLCRLKPMIHQRTFSIVQAERYSDAIKRVVQQKR